MPHLQFPIPKQMIFPVSSAEVNWALEFGCESVSSFKGGLEYFNRDSGEIYRTASAYLESSGKSETSV